jgi:hypothetical protein
MRTRACSDVKSDPGCFGLTVKVGEGKLVNKLIDPQHAAAVGPDYVNQGVGSVPRDVSNSFYIYIAFWHHAKVYWRCRSPTADWLLLGHCYSHS